MRVYGKRQSKISLSFAPLLLFALGCAGNYPVTDGFHRSLPQADAPIVVWGNSPTVVETAARWFQKQGLRVIERSKFLSIIDEHRLRLTHTTADDEVMLQIGKLLGAETVVFAKASITSDGFSNRIRQGYVPLHAATVSVQGVNVSTEAVAFSGTAAYTGGIAGSPQDSLAKLTCQALATAWGGRSSGHRTINSEDMCALRIAAASTSP